MGLFSGNATDSMRGSVGMKFTTFDRDNDQLFDFTQSTNCAEIKHDAWWHKSCSDW
ncbi:hypothetical protein KR222_010003, partial [Zaprionus bogoriensis]